MKARKTWTEKLADDKGLPRCIRLSGKMAKKWGAGIMVIPAPKEVDAVMKRVPAGQVITINEIRARLARKHRADSCCPVTTGIFAWIAAHAAEEARAAGRTRITPWWRTLKTGGLLNEKYPGGALEQKKRLEAESIAVVRSGNKKSFAVKPVQASRQQ